MNDLRKAQLYCANWSTGKCCGVVFKIKQKRKAGYIYPIQQILDTKKSNHDCTVNQGCKYFKNFVLPELVNH